MTGLRLAKLPDRNPRKLSIQIMPELHDRLEAYAEAYRQQYGQDEPVTELIPYMLASFLDADRGFSRRDAKP